MKQELRHSDPKGGGHGPMAPPKYAPGNHPLAIKCSIKFGGISLQISNSKTIKAFNKKTANLSSAEKNSYLVAMFLTFAGQSF